MVHRFRGAGIDRFLREGEPVPVGSDEPERALSGLRNNVHQPEKVVGVVGRLLSPGLLRLLPRDPNSGWGGAPTACSVAGSPRGTEASHRAQSVRRGKTQGGAAIRCEVGIGGVHRDATCQGVDRDEKIHGLHRRAAPPEQRAEVADLTPQILGWARW